MITYTAIESYPTAESKTPLFSLHMPLGALQELGQFYAHGDFQKFKKSLDDSFMNPDFYDSNKFYLSEMMIQAIRLGRTCFVKELLYHGLPILPIYIYEATKLNANSDLGKFLGKWVGYQPADGPNASPDSEMPTWLLDHGADPNRRCNIDFTPLSQAVEHASVPIANLLLSRGGDVTIGQVLHHAVARESDAVVVLKLLIARGAPIKGIMYQDHQPSWDMSFFMGETPLHKAVYLRNIDAIHCLISEGADLNIKDVRNQTVTQCADESIQGELIKACES